uniref:Dystroglycan 1 n=2 Tax=Anopheles triannulatus TaxID=58253 RepID=A0A2M4AJI0_9DIPT
MNLRYQETFCVMLLLFSSIIAEDFDFVREVKDDVKPLAAEPLGVDSPTKLIHQKALDQCLPSENRITLSLVLRSKNWNHIQQGVKQRTINTLSKYFLVPEESFNVLNVKGNDLRHMLEKAIKHGKKPESTRKTLGIVQFKVGCGDTVFKSVKDTTRKLNTYLADINNLTELEFTSWILSKHAVAPESQRSKREANDDEYDYDYDDDEEDDDEGETTEVPHPHRHHHGSSEATTTQRTAPASVTTPRQAATATVKDLEYNYDDEYDDEENENVDIEPTTSSTVPESRNVPPSSTEKTVPSSTEATTPKSSTIELTSTTTTTTTTTTTVAPTTTTSTTSTTTTTTTTTEAPTTTTTTIVTTELDEPTNLHPIIRNRFPKQPVIAGKVYNYVVPIETFYDNEDGNNLRLELFDSREQPLKHNSWIQFNEETREIYGLPLEKDVSRWQYKLRATDSGNLTVTETVDIVVQQHKSHRSVNHEISLALRLSRKFTNNVDWQMVAVRGIAKVVGDSTLNNIVVRDIRNSLQDPKVATLVYTNETLPKDRCPEEKLDELVALLTEKALNDALFPDITVKSIEGQQIGQCTKPTLPKAKPTQSISRNYGPQARNQVDQVNATVGHLLVFKVPTDTFYDPEDGNELKLKLLTTERQMLDTYHWLQFDSKNQEFYGVPRPSDIGRKEYLLMAEDREGLTATDALVVVVNPSHKRDYSVLFELTLDTTHEQFNTAQVQRRFIERLASVFGDSSTHYIRINHVRPIHHTGQVQVSFFNTTLIRPHQRCPEEEIEGLRNILLHQDSTIRAKVRETLGQEFSLQNVSLVPLGNCHGFDTPHHATSEPEKAITPPISKDDYLLTFVLPTVIILVMLLIASIIACVLYKRRLTGKMELGTDEERKSFRSKGIPVIFQDELDEKPEIGNKSPVILKDEKPPLLPPSYSSTNNDGDNEDVDEYVPPPAVVVGGRESRGKSPVTPSYRRPPPYVSP